MSMKGLRPRLVSISLLVFCLLLIFIRAKSLDGKFTDGQSVEVQGLVISEPKVFSKEQEINLGGAKVVLLNTENEVLYGDSLKAKGFYKDGKIYSDNFEITSSDFIFFRFRSQMLEFFRSNLPEPHASLVAGMVLGVKSYGNFEFTNKLRLTGTSHVVVASGMNVVLISFFLIEVSLLVLSRRKALLLAVIGIWIYVLLAGFEAPLIRAAIMTTISVIAARQGKMTQTIRVLIITALVMLLINPYWVSDVGFQLSFMATLGLILFEAKVSNKLKIVPAFVRSGFSTSFSAQIGVAPVLFVTFGFISIVGLIVNPLVLWTVPYITIGGMIAGSIGVISEPLGRLGLYLIYPLTSWFIFVVNIFS